MKRGKKNTLLQSEIPGELPEPKHSGSESHHVAMGMRRVAAALAAALHCPRPRSSHHITMISSDLNCHLKLSAHMLTQGTSFSGEGGRLSHSLGWASSGDWELALGPKRLTRMSSSLASSRVQ